MEESSSHHLLLRVARASAETVFSPLLCYLEELMKPGHTAAKASKTQIGADGFLLTKASHRGSAGAGGAGASMPTVKVGVTG